MTVGVGVTALTVDKDSPPTAATARPPRPNEFGETCRRARVIRPQDGKHQDQYHDDHDRHG